MDDESENFSDKLAQLAKEATQEAFVKAREVVGSEGLLLVEDRQLIRLFPDDSFVVLRDIK
jgi:hypothetical protein